MDVASLKPGRFIARGDVRSVIFAKASGAQSGTTNIESRTAYIVYIHVPHMSDFCQPNFKFGDLIPYFFCF